MVNWSIFRLIESIFSAMIRWLASNRALSACRRTFSSNVSVYFAVSRSMDFCNEARKSLFRWRRVTSHVTIDDMKPLGNAHISICIITLSIVLSPLTV